MQEVLLGVKLLEVEVEVEVEVQLLKVRMKPPSSTTCSRDIYFWSWDVSPLL